MRKTCPPPNTIRHDADRRRNVRVLLEEADLLLEELEAMDEEERRAAEGHHAQLNRTLERARHYCGEVGPSPREQERRRARSLQATAQAQ